MNCGRRRILFSTHFEIVSKTAFRVAGARLSNNIAFFNLFSSVDLYFEFKSNNQIKKINKYRDNCTGTHGPRRSPGSRDGLVQGPLRPIKGNGKNGPGASLDMISQTVPIQN